VTRASALRRVWSAPWLWLGIGMAQLALAAALAVPLRAVLRAAMGPFTITGESRLFGALAELVSRNPTIVAALITALAGGAALAALLAPLFAGAAIRRLAGPCAKGEQARACVLHYPAALVIGIYGLVLRALLAFVAAAFGTIHSSLQIAAIVVILSFTAVVVDLARVRVVLEGARGLHPRTFIRALVTVVRAPGLWLRSGLIGGLHWGLAFAMLWTAVHGLDAAWSPWAVRGIALLAAFVALWRLATAVEHVAAAPNAPPTRAP
jgi:hypothetical protein